MHDLCQNKTPDLPGVTEVSQSGMTKNVKKSAWKRQNAAPDLYDGLPGSIPDKPE